MQRAQRTAAEPHSISFLNPVAGRDPATHVFHPDIR
jgi:hypothetical protein